MGIAPKELSSNNTWQTRQSASAAMFFYTLQSSSLTNESELNKAKKKNKTELFTMKYE